MRIAPVLYIYLAVGKEECAVMRIGRAVGQNQFEA